MDVSSLTAALDDVLTGDVGDEGILFCSDRMLVLCVSLCTCL